MKTHVTKPADVTRRWWLVDAEGVVLGRLASEVAIRLRGKHKPTYSPHLDVGDHVVIINASKIVLTGAKLTQKNLYRHSGYPGGLTQVDYATLMLTRPEVAVEKAVRGMLPSNKLGRAMLKKLKVYAGAEHPHEAQGPEVLDLKEVAAPKHPEQAHTVEELSHHA